MEMQKAMTSCIGIAFATDLHNEMSYLKFGKNFDEQKIYRTCDNVRRIANIIFNQIRTLLQAFSRLSRQLWSAHSSS